VELYLLRLVVVSLGLVFSRTKRSGPFKDHPDTGKEQADAPNLIENASLIVKAVDHDLVIPSRARDPCRLSEVGASNSEPAVCFYLQERKVTGIAYSKISLRACSKMPSYFCAGPKQLYQDQSPVGTIVSLDHVPRRKPWISTEYVERSGIHPI